MTATPLVTACGRICMHRKRRNISTVLAGQRLGIKEVDDGIWIVSFMHYDLGAPRQSLSTGHVLYYILTPAEGIGQVLVPRANGSERTPYD